MHMSHVGKDSEACTEAAAAEYTNNYLITPWRWWVLTWTLAVHLYDNLFI